MSKLDDLIAELCPDGVEYVFVGDLCDIQKGNQINKNKLKDKDKYPVYNGGICPSGYHDNFNNEANTIAISQGGANAGFVNWVDVPFYAGAHCYTIKNVSQKILNRFLYFILKNKQNYIQNAKHGAGIPGLKVDAIKNIKIPLPPLPVQQEIVRILDSFTELTRELTRELTTELTMRQKQYEYYRDKLLSREELEKLCPDGVEYKRLGQVLKIRNGRDYKNFSKGNIPVYGSGGIIAYINQYAYDKPSVLIPRKGSIDKLYFVDEPFWTVDTIFYTEINAEVIKPKFVFYFLQSQYLERLNTAGGVPSLTQAVLNKIFIPLPPLSVQERIVSILDRFDALCKDLTSGLPAEIEARQKQYEYYRDKLLTFKEKSA